LIFLRVCFILQVHRKEGKTMGEHYTSSYQAIGGTVSGDASPEKRRQFWVGMNRAGSRDTTSNDGNPEFFIWTPYSSVYTYTGTDFGALGVGYRLSARAQEASTLAEKPGADWSFGGEPDEEKPEYVN
jgi:hypothetical protein